MSNRSMYADISELIGGDEKKEFEKDPREDNLHIRNIEDDPNYQTGKDMVIEHKRNVHDAITVLVGKLQHRALHHDDSKLEDPERKYYFYYTPRMRELEFGSEEYQRAREKMLPGLEHHFKMNRHHPEHFENKINDMNLVDIVEMFSDWYIASQQNADGSNDLEESLEYQKKTFDIPDMLISIFKNTARDYTTELPHINHDINNQKND